MTDPIEARLRTALAGKYEIETKLGEGGMALVFLARDVKHDRKVAVKILRPELAAALGPDRFLREIQITAKLSHPHILPLYDSGEADGFLYYVMPFIQGESLNDLLRREQQLSIDEAIRIAREVAEALSHAHMQGLVHRDIKPDNIMLSGGHAVVADFGIARAVSEAGGDKLTQTGMAVGTPSYMSPEQATGDANIDGRTDIYALGCALYEMLVGQVPFTGPTPLAIIARHTMDNLTPPSIMRQSIPEELEDVIFCAMAKTPADRFRTAGEMAEALKSVEQGGTAGKRATMARRAPTAAYRPPASVGRKSLAIGGTVAVVLVVGVVGALAFRPGNAPRPVAGGLDPTNVAVLYFEDLSPDGGWNHVADGITEGLIERLSGVSTLSVISRNGVESFRDSDLARDSIARALSVGSLVTGSVEPIGDRLRITARLIEGDGGTDVDRQAFEVPADELLAAQDSVVERVSRLLRRRLGEEIQVRQQRMETASVQAWGLVQRAERLRKDAQDLRRSGDGEAAMAAYDRSDSVLALAQRADPQWAQPIVAAAWNAYNRASLVDGNDRRAEQFRRSIEEADRALTLEPGDPESLEIRGKARYRLWRLRLIPDHAEADALLADARKDLEDAVDRDPSLARAHLELSFLYYDYKDPNSALMAAQRAYQADAYLSTANLTLDRLFWGTIDNEDLNGAQRWCSEGNRRFADDYKFVRCQLWLMTTPAVSPDVNRGWDLVARLDSLVSGHAGEFTRVEGQILMGGVLARAQDVDSAIAVLDRAHDRITAEIDPELFLLTVEAYERTLTDEVDVAIDLLKRYTAANPDHAYRETVGTKWWWRAVREHPRYREIMDR